MTTDRWASGTAYERYVGRWSRRIAVGFLEWLGVPPGARWADIGAGTGALTEVILERCDPAWVVGVEPAAPFVDHARAAVDDPRARFTIGSAAATGLDADSVDVAVAGLVLNFVPDLEAALLELGRVVVPGGLVAGYVWDYADGMEFMRRFWDAAVAVDPSVAALDQGRRFPIAAPGPLETAFQRAGFADVAVRAIEIETRFVDFDDFWLPFLGGTGVAPTYVAGLDEGARAAIREALHRTMPSEPDGSIGLRARAWAVRGDRPPVI